MANEILRNEIDLTRPYSSTDALSDFNRIQSSKDFSREVLYTRKEIPKKIPQEIPKEIQIIPLPEETEFHKFFKNGELNLSGEGLTVDQANQIIRYIISNNPIKSIRKLNLGVNNLSEVPEEVLNLIYIQTLDLSGNSITQIPKPISQLKDLEYLLIGENNFDDKTMLYLKGLSLKRLNLYIDILDGSLNS